MTLQEVCQILGKSEITLITNFKRTQENLKKKGIVLQKKGVGKNASYEILYQSEEKND